MQNLRCAISVKSNFLLILLFGVLLTGCSDVFEKDVSDFGIVLVSPGDSILAQTTLVHFKWEAIDENSSYRLQVAKPSFEKPELFVLDTLLTGTTFDFSFDQGIYQWRVRGENSSSHTDYSTRTFIMDSISDLKKEVVILRSPENNTTSGKNRVLFKWDKIAIANYYTIKIFKEAWNGELYNTKALISADTIGIDMEEGTFVWSVQASDSLFLYTDSGIPVSDFPVASPVSQYELDSLQVGRYQWKVKSIDKAGNQSSYSPSWFFTVQ